MTAVIFILDLLCVCVRGIITSIQNYILCTIQKQKLVQINRNIMFEEKKPLATNISE